MIIAIVSAWFCGATITLLIACGHGPDMVFVLTLFGQPFDVGFCVWLLASEGHVFGAAPGP